MSASKGNTIATWDWPKFAPPETLRLFFLKKPKTQTNIMSIKKVGNKFKLVDKEFDIEGLIEELDDLARIYFGLKKEDPNKIPYLKRLYEVCMNNKIPSEVPKRIPFRYAIIMCQLKNILSEEKILENAIQVVKKKYQLTDINESIMSEIKLGLQRAEYWVKHFAPDNLIIDIKEKIDPNIVSSLTEAQFR